MKFLSREELLKLKSEFSLLSFEKKIEREFKLLSSPRIYVPTGILSPIDIKFAQKFDWYEGYKHFDPNAYTPEQWTLLMRLRARKWLEDKVDLPIKSMQFIYQTGILASGVSQTFTNKDIFTTATTGTNYNVDGIATQLILKTWGAGAGGGGSDAAGRTAGSGGGGGFAGCTVNVTPGETLIYVVGDRGTGGSAVGYPGSGAGYCGVFRSSQTQGNALAMPGSGGAGGGAAVNGTAGAGGAGGGTNGVTGGIGGTTTGGGGATGATGGAAGTGGTNGVAGSALTGGRGSGSATTAGGAPNGGGSDVNKGHGGGGGAGYAGGGGGAMTGNGLGGGGGGGSGITTGTSTTLTAGSGTAVANSGDADYSGSAGVGGAGATNGAGSNGNAGRIVIIW